MISEKSRSANSAPMTIDHNSTELVSRRQNVCIFDEVVGGGAAGAGVMESINA
jgi:hypothetical protein